MTQLPEGKISHEILKKLTTMIGTEHSSIIQHAKPGLDVGALDLGEINEFIEDFYKTDGKDEPYLIYKSDPITFPTENPGKYLVLVNSNDLATAGAHGYAMTVTMLLPRNCTEKEVMKLQKQLDEAAKAKNIAILGGHTEITTSVNSVVLSGNMIGFVPPQYFVGIDIQAGDDIILSGWIGAEGTGILLSEGIELFQQKLTEEQIKMAKELGMDIDITKRTLETNREYTEYIHMIHDVTEGGVMAALYEAVEPHQYGVTIEKDQLDGLVHDSTKRICELVDINPYRLIGSGAVLFFVDAKITNELISFLKNYDQPVAKLGRITEKLSFTVDGENINPPESDALIRGLANLSDHN